MDSSEDNSRIERGGNTGGRRLRVEGQKRTENEYKQMLRLAELETKELKDSLRYVEIQLAKTKETLRQTNKKYEDSQEEVQKCHEQISRSANINHAQVSQIEDMAKRLGEVDNVQKEIQEKSKIKLQQYQNEIDLREMEINRIKKMLEQKDNDCSLLTTERNMMQDRVKDLEEEMEMKSGENNRLRKQVTDMDSAMKDLYKSRKGNGTLQIEMESLKSDNERLIALLKDTSEYADCEDSQILKSAATKTLKGANGLVDAFSANKRARGVSADIVGKRVKKVDNDWIPTEAVRVILKIKDQFDGKMTETAVSQILYELNSIWRNIMRTEAEAIKNRLTAQIQDLRRQVVTKQAYDKGELIQEISRTKKQLTFANKQLKTKIRVGGKENTQQAASHEQYGNEDVERSIRLVETIGIQKKQLEEQNEELRSRVEAYEQDRSHSRTHAANAAVNRLNFASGLTNSESGF